MTATLLLIALLTCHYLADFCLTWPALIQAKSDGRNLWPILCHAGVHAVLMGVCLLLFGVDGQMLLLLMALELVTHFAIDTCKTVLSLKFPVLADIKQKAYWLLYGLDQLLHQSIVVVIWYIAAVRSADFFDDLTALVVPSTFLGLS